MFKKIKLFFKKEKNDNCLKCQYHELFEKGKKIFNEWDKKNPAPKQLVSIQKQLTKIKKSIKIQHKENELKFCSNHPEIIEFLPSEWT